MAPIMKNGNDQRGHMLLVVLVLATTMTVFFSLALQPIATTAQRSKERALLYRGEHLATGIRRFYNQHGRFPFELEELLENEPRLIRQLYSDPMTETGGWTLVYLSPLDIQAIQGMNRVTQRVLGMEDRLESNSENVQAKPGLSANPDSVFTIKTQQITGVRSQSNEEGLTVRDDSRIYSDWLFSALPQNQTNTASGKL